MRWHIILLSTVATLSCLGGCAKQPHQATAQDVAAAKQEADHEVAQARIEASKDVKSAVKIAGSNSNDVARARVMAAYDVAMATAEGDHQVAMARCLTLQTSAIQTCEDQANADFEVAKAAAKNIRVARQQ